MQNFKLEANNFKELHSMEILRSRLSSNTNTFSIKTFATVDISSLYDYLVSMNCVVNMDNEKSILAFSGDSLWLEVNNKTWSLEINIFGDKQKVLEFRDKINEKFHMSGSYIRWVYDERYGSSVNIPLNLDQVPIQEMYPFMHEDLDSYYNRYANSTANILVLIGPPGTGKTTFIRGLLANQNASATLTYNKKSMNDDSFFVDWLESDTVYMVMEDADEHLAPRSDGNPMMSRFLSIGDGLIRMNNKKIIFSTNLPSIRDIDPALVRKGRCFDILEFRELNHEETKILCDKVNIEVPSGSMTHSIAEIFASSKNEMTHKKSHNFGFI